jgi:hypothetical protein
MQTKPLHDLAHRHYPNERQFTVRLPHFDEKAPASSTEPDALFATKPVKPLTAMVVDDNADAAQMLATLVGNGPARSGGAWRRKSA